MKKLKCNIKEVPVITARGGELRIVVSPKTVGSSHIVMGVSKLSPNEIVNKHVHDYSEKIFYMLKGKGMIRMDSYGDIIFENGDAVLVPKGVVHSIENIGTEVMEFIFAISPPAPNPELGHREITTENIYEKSN